MKKILLVLLIPVILFSVFAVRNLSADTNQEFNITQGNILTDKTYETNKYVALDEKSELSYNVTIPASFQKYADDGELELYLEPETLAIAVRVKENGYVYSSYNFNDTFAGKTEGVINPIKSGVTLELYKDSTPVSTSYLDENPIATGEKIAAATSSIQPITGGFRAKIDFDHPEIMIKFDLEVTITDGQLQVHIPKESISEYNPNMWISEEQYYILRNIVVFPYFGSTTGETDGYVMIPDGSGALIELTTTPESKSTFSLDVYGEDLGYKSASFSERTVSQKEIELVTMPIYGIIHDVGNTGFYTVIEEGANYAKLNFKSKGVVNDYYNTFFSYRYRESYEQYQSRSNEEQFRISFPQETNVYDLTVNYNFLSGDAADYVGMAKAYQSYLLERGLLGEKSRKNYTQTPTKVDFIGTEIEDGILGTTISDITSYQEVIDIMKTFKEDGYNELITSFKTYTKKEEGYRYDLYRSLGGRGDFEDMLEYLDDEGIEFSYYLDYIRSYKDYSTKHAQTLSRREIFYVEPTQMYFGHFVNDTNEFLGYAENDIDWLNKFGLNSVSLAGLDRTVFTSYDDGIIYSQNNQIDVIDMLNYYDQEQVRTNIYKPFDFMYAYTDTYFDAPLSSSDFSVTSASIPFVQLVIGGYMDMYSPYLNFASDETVTLLRMVEYGVFPSYLLTGGNTYELKLSNASRVYISEYDVLRNRIKYYYDSIDEGLTATINNEMVDHVFLDEGVVKVTYEDGTVIVINYTQADVILDTRTISPLSYEVMN